jgi:23S rRNA pseudouridine1911/1915/1917 synthase
MSQSFKASQEGRLDIVISEQLSISRSKAQKIILNGVTVDGRQAKKAGFEVKAGQEVTYSDLAKEDNKFVETDIPLNIIYEDEDVLVINKPRGLVVHPAAGHHSDTLANALAFRMKDTEEESDDDFRMGIVHRIDKDTSGLLVVAKSEEAKDFLVEQLTSHSVQREYFCLAYGFFKDCLFQVDAPIGRDKYNRKKMAVDVDNGKRAVTHFEVLRQYKNAALLKCSLETGRTHQIRVHLSYLGHPIVGDELYTSRKCLGADQGQLLHAFRLAFIHPRTKKEMVFYAPSDDYFKKNIIDFCLEKAKKGK